MNKKLSSLLYAFHFPGLAFVMTLVPFFWHGNSINLIYSLLFFWIIIDPQRIHYSFMVFIGLFQDLYTYYGLGVYGCLYALFMIFLLTQRRQLLNRSFLLQWVAFAVTLFLIKSCQELMEYSVYNRMGSIFEIVSDTLISILIFPLIYKINALLYKKVQPINA